MATKTAATLTGGDIVTSDLGLTAKVALTMTFHTGDIDVIWADGARERVAPDTEFTLAP